MKFWVAFLVKEPTCNLDLFSLSQGGPLPTARSAWTLQNRVGRLATQSKGGSRPTAPPSKNPLSRPEMTSANQGQSSPEVSGISLDAKKYICKLIFDITGHSLQVHLTFKAAWASCKRQAPLVGTKNLSLYLPFFTPQDPQYGWVTCLKHRPLQKAEQGLQEMVISTPESVSQEWERASLAGLQREGWTGKGRTHSIWVKRYGW